MYKNDHFNKTGSGQTQRDLKRERRLLVRSTDGIFPGAQDTPTQVRKTPFFETFMHKNDHFTKTGSGQT